MEFTEASFPMAIKWLFESNGYSVEGPIHLKGAEIDLVATQLNSLRPMRVYIEATIQYVDNTKYGKDLTKLVMLRNEVGAQCLIVSAKGFTADVRERASEAGIDTYTYDELFRAFERTEPYLDRVLGESDLAVSLRNLNRIYEEPIFTDRHGTEQATGYLDGWLRDSSKTSPWLVIVGEYGTGKTALTQILQYRWANLYKDGTGTPLPFRIELRDFNRQFDARGLLHHFLDRNSLSHIPVTFVESMIATGRVVLILDGYDEMAQYLNVRERRACLEALADLAVDGARGILTSRPNYFSEAEELRVFEVLYQQLSVTSKASRLDREILEEERRLDGIFEKFLIDRYERELCDLTPEQTEALVWRKLADDPEGAELVVRLLRRVFRTSGDDGTSLSLSGKPVIVSYLLDVASELKLDHSEDSVSGDRLSEWQIFNLILDKLMQRDFRRTPQLIPSERRRFLREMALRLAMHQEKSLDEESLRSLVGETFGPLIQRKNHEGVADFAESLVDDLRSSATLSRAELSKGYAVQFSHNSLREFLLTDRLLAFRQQGLVGARIAITDSMRTFARALPSDIAEATTAEISSGWPTRGSRPGLDQLLCLVWSGLVDRHGGDVRSTIAGVAGPGLDMSKTTLRNLSFAVEPTSASVLNGIVLEEAELTEIDFSRASARGANFRGSILDACQFRETDLTGADFDGSFILDCDLSDAIIKGASFLGLDLESKALYSSPRGSVILSGPQLLGFLRYHGAETDPVDAFHVYSCSPDFEILEKILRNLGDGGWSQRRGLEMRGASARNMAFARRFVGYLISGGFVESKRGKAELVRPTVSGRSLVLRFLEDQNLDHAILAFLRREFPAVALT